MFAIKSELSDFEYLYSVITPDDLQNKRILISPLNWGMGHVSRCIGIIHQLLEQKNDVIIACDLPQRRVFSEYFEHVSFIEHDGYPFHFGGKGHFGWDLLSRSNALRKRLKQERAEVEHYVKQHEVDVVLSDHRYGFISQLVPSIFITHQVNLPVKWYEKGVDAVHASLMNRFHFVWVLDDEHSTLAGKLSENCPSNGCYVGHYSRFSLESLDEKSSFEDVLVASGPLVYAEELIHRLIERHDEFKSLAVVHSTSLTLPDYIHEVKGSWKEKDAVIRNASRIISRSGYSTLMDCRALNLPGLFIPTKGQAEQEYLAQRWKAQNS